MPSGWPQSPPFRIVSLSMTSMSCHSSSHMGCCSSYTKNEKKWNSCYVHVSIKSKKVQGRLRGQEFQAKWKIRILVEVNIFLHAIEYDKCRRMNRKASLRKKPPEVLIPSLLYTATSSAWPCRHLSLGFLLNRIVTPKISASVMMHCLSSQIMQICK